jgi:putative ABC transport system permease protein
MHFVSGRAFDLSDVPKCMKLHNLQIMLRSLKKDGLLTFLNIVGLAAGFASAFVIITYLRHELSFDRFHSKADRIYRITEELTDDARRFHSAKNHSPVMEILQHNLAFVEKATRIFPYPAYISNGLVKYKEEGIVFADSSFFQIFSFDNPEGRPTPLTDPFTAVMTERVAQKYFGSDDAVGKTFWYQNERGKYEFTVNAVVPDVPSNSHFNFSIVLNFSSLKTIMPGVNNWHYPPVYIYVSTMAEVDERTIDRGIAGLIKDHFPEEIIAEKRNYFAQRLTDIHMKSHLDEEWKANSSEWLVPFFTAIAVFLIALASINFTNLYTSQTARRVREVGIRKVLGAGRSQLVRNFITESLILSLISCGVALGLSELVLMTFFQDLLGYKLTLEYLLQDLNWLYIVGFVFLVATVNGIYPAFYMTRAKITHALKGKGGNAGRVFTLRRALVTFQFFLSALMIVFVITASRQVKLLQSGNLGFDGDPIVVVRMVDQTSSKNYITFKNDLKSSPFVESVAVSSEIPGGTAFYGFEINGEGLQQNVMSMKSLGVDEDFLPTYDIKLISGRNFDAEIPTDERDAFILNEAAAKMLGWNSETAIGKTFELTIYTGGPDLRKGKVIGVVKDFHFESMYKKIEPLVIYVNKHYYYTDYVSVKCTGPILDAVNSIEMQWKKFNPDKPADFFFLDERLQSMYVREARLAKIFSSFGILSLVISCLGLFGLAMFSAEQRLKEISLRKVLGAKASQLFTLLSGEYLVLILLGNIVAWPVAYFGLRDWLSTFPYHVELSLTSLVLTMSICLFVALIPIVFQSSKVVFTNPINALRQD